MKILRRLTGDGFGQRAFRIARTWSNGELRKFAPLLEGAAVNVSAWEDKDKQGATYRDYFSGCHEYYITNYGTSQGVLQGARNEYYLDLEKPLPEELEERFDVVFNHTTLEHVWDFRTAFANLCRMSRQHLVLVVPWLQPVHSDYGDYWRFSPAAIVRLCCDNDFVPLYVSWNESHAASVYVFCIASREPSALVAKFPALRPIEPSADLLRAPRHFAGREAFSWRPWRSARTRTL